MARGGWNIARTLCLGVASLLAGSCGRHRATHRVAELPAEAQAALHGLPVARRSSNPPQLQWKLGARCRLDYVARFDNDAFPFSMVGGSFRDVALNYPARLAPAARPSSLLLEIGDFYSRFFVDEVTPPMEKDGKQIFPGIAQGPYELGREPPPWSGPGLRPGLRVFFPPLPPDEEARSERYWLPLQPSSAIDARTKLEGWFSVHDEPMAFVSSQSGDGRFKGTYLILGSGRLLWARVTVSGTPDSVAEAKLVSACDGSTLAP